MDAVPMEKHVVQPYIYLKAVSIFHKCCKLIKQIKEGLAIDEYINLHVFNKRCSKRIKIFMFNSILNCFLI